MVTDVLSLPRVAKRQNILVILSLCFRTKLILHIFLEFISYLSTQKNLLYLQRQYSNVRENILFTFSFLCDFFQGESNFSSFKLNSQRNSIPYKYKIFAILKQKCCRKLYLKLYYTNSFKFIFNMFLNSYLNLQWNLIKVSPTYSLIFDLFHILSLWFIMKAIFCSLKRLLYDMIIWNNICTSDTEGFWN